MQWSLKYVGALSSVFQTSANHISKLVLDSLGDVKPVVNHCVTSPLNISETVGDTGLVPNDHQ